MMMCCSCPPCLEAATHQCVVLFLLVVFMAASPSLCISSQHVASWQSQIEDYEEVSVVCGSGVVRVWPCLTWWYLVFVRRG